MKKRTPHTKISLLSTMLVCSCAFHAQAQTGNTPNNAQKERVVAVGSQYSRSGLHQRMWGKHYRPEWATPVNVPSLYLDTAMGGLMPYEKGGSFQTKTLRLRTADNKEYVLRSVGKSYDRAVPEIYRNTFIENILNDQVSSMHPYAALTIPSMANAAGIYHTEPIIRFVPKQAALGEFNDEYGDQLYLLEQRPDGNWREADNFGNPEKIISTENLIAKLMEDNDNLIDQQLYVRARLFDMFIGDWSRREDQWRWAATEKNGKTIYKPIPRDRDQAYAKFDGVLLGVAISAAGLGHMESFKDDIKDVTTFNFTARNLDRRMANECDLQVWVNTAKELQQALTDEVIETSIKQLPPELFPISGEKIIANLKSRRDHLVKFATRYYNFLAKEIDVPGTEKREHFEVNRISEAEMKLSIYKIKKDDSRETAPFYERVFNTKVTKELRLYGIAGNDSYQINGEVKNDIDLLIIGGKDKDVITDASGSKNAVHIYDDANNTITAAPRTKLHLSSNDTIHAYKYAAYNYDKKGFKPTIFFSNYDRFYIGLGYEITRQGWRKDPFAYQHGVYARYSITQNAMSFGYQGILNQFIGNWDLQLNADYDAIRWTNYFGIGNETVELPKDDLDFYRVRSREIYAGVSLKKQIGASGAFGITPFYQGTRVIKDEGRLHTETARITAGDPLSEDSYTWDNYTGLAMNFSIANVDDEVVPTKGITFSTKLAHTRSLESSRQVNSIDGTLNFYLPVTKQLVLAIRNGGATLSGEPKFYQLNTIGGSQTLRGYRRDRFRGRTAFFNSNELQWHFNVRSVLFNGKAGPVAFYDLGRVWQPGEDSNLWHTGYGAGFMIAPFNKINASVTYGISKENKVFHIRLSKAF